MNVARMMVLVAAVEDHVFIYNRQDHHRDSFRWAQEALYEGGNLDQWIETALDRVRSNTPKKRSIAGYAHRDKRSKNFASSSSG